MFQSLHAAQCRRESPKHKCTTTKGGETNNRAMSSCAGSRWTSVDVMETSESFGCSCRIRYTATPSQLSVSNQTNCPRCQSVNKTTFTQDTRTAVMTQWSDEGFTKTPRSRDFIQEPCDRITDTSFPEGPGGPFQNAGLGKKIK